MNYYILKSVPKIKVEVEKKNTKWLEIGIAWEIGQRC